MTMEKFLYPNHPLRCIICGSSNVGKSVFVTNFFLNFFNDFVNIYLYSPSPHQDLNQKLIKCFSNYLTFNVIPNNINKEDIGLVICERANHKDFEKLDTEKETYEPGKN